MKLLIFLFSTSRSIHRFFLLVAAFLILFMAGSGLIMREPELGTKLPIDPGLWRYLHNKISIVTSIALFIMMTTGLYMYIHPHLIKLFRKKPAATTPPPVEKIN